MSDREIRDEVLDELGSLPALDEDIEDALRPATNAVLRRHIHAGNLRPLVLWAVENFDTNCGDEYIRPLSAALVDAGDIRSLRRLWKGIIANRRRHYEAWRKCNVNKLQEPQAGLESALRDYSEALRQCGEDELAAGTDRDLEDLVTGRSLRKAKRPSDRRPMSDDLFWQLIEETAPQDGSSNEHLCELQTALSAFGRRALRTFQKILLQQRERANRWDLWAVAFILRGGCGDDAFDYFRSWLVLQGRERFESTLSDPTVIAEFTKGNDPTCEGLLWVAEDAYEEAYDAPMPTVTSQAIDPTGIPWEEDDLPILFPKLWAQTHE